MKTSFPYEVKPSVIFKFVRRPVVFVSFWSNKFNRFIRDTLIVDTGADYTILPKYFSKVLGIDLEKDCISYISKGIGGKEKVYVAKDKVAVMIGDVKREIPVGFLSHDDIPPLLGREECLNTFKLTLENFITTFSSEE